MFHKIRETIVSNINRHAALKKYLLWLYDFYYQYVPFFVGFFTRYPSYFKHILNSKVIAKPGTLSFAGGAFNPGALVIDENNIILLARAQNVPWFKARGKSRKFYLVGSPVVFLLETKSFKTKESFIIKNITGFPEDDNYAIEDFRLFTWKGKKMINHSLITKRQFDGLTKQKRVQPALSFLNEKDKTFTFFGIPKVDFPLQTFEKNWVYKENEEDLVLFYSVSPYKVLVLEDEENFIFNTIINQQLGSKIDDPGSFGTRVSFSTNPIDFDDQHWLIIIHQIKYKITGRCYFHWAVIIDKSTLLPVKITSKSIFSGMGARGRVPGYRYVSSILKVENDILFLAGEGDVYVTVTNKSIQDLQSLFVPI